MHSLGGGWPLRLRDVSLCSAHEKHLMPFRRRRDYRSRHRGLVAGADVTGSLWLEVHFNDYKCCTREMICTCAVFIFQEPHFKN